MPTSKAAREDERVLFINDKGYHTCQSCQKEFFIPFGSEDYRFCPSCGKAIRVEKKER